MPSRQAELTDGLEAGDVAAGPVSDVSDLRVAFGTAAGTAMAVRGVSFSIDPGETVGLVGESGSGKSVTALSLLRLLPARGVRLVADRLCVAGLDVLTASTSELSDVRGAQAAIIFQDPLRALTPTRRVGEQVAETLRRHQKVGKRESRAEAVELLARVGIADATRRARNYPHQFSGGQRQRIMIAIAIACRPQLLIADEPTTALDVTTQAQILDLLLGLRAELGMSLLLITHDLSVVARVCDRVLVMYAGRIVEEGSTRELFHRPRHPYTAGLLSSIPRLDQPERAVHPIPGEAVDALARIDGCAFAARCTLATEKCRERPDLLAVDPGHRSACWHWEGVR
jgi:oligopeptide/dipeptide ABC transporter ATP-binding protein